MLKVALEILKKYFGYTTFRKGQDVLIEHILSGEDVLGIMPTAAGKSICYQVPALVKEGVTLVISPLISLMKDQVDSLCQMGIQAAFINSSLGINELNSILNNAKNGKYKLIYVAPERLENQSFIELLKTLSISIIAVDEAHCVSQWGHDFRPSYVQIPKMIKSLPERPIIIAFTATATPEVKEDIVKLLQLKKPFTLVNGFDRENLYFEVNKPEDKLEYVLKYLEQNKENSGIIYASTRKTVESLSEKLKKRGYKARKYHAGLSDDERTKNQEDFLNDRVSIVVATNAFGMGIDKSNIRFVIHYNMPKNMESYYQEAGRAGRDGESSECLLLYGPSDIITNRLLIENGNDGRDKTGDYQKLNEMIDFCNTDKCLRTYILNYFGEKDAPSGCENCGNCNSDIESTDITLESQKIMSCIKRMGERFGSELTADVLRGSAREKIVSMKFNELSTYGIMKEYSKETIKEIISFLIAHDFIALVGDQYPVLRLNDQAYNVLKGSATVSIKRVIVKDGGKEKKGGKGKSKANIDNNLFEILRGVRKEIAEEQGVPPFIVFSDASLNDMCKKYPTSKKEMLDISGVGNFKLEKYGDRFILAIEDYVEKNNIETAGSFAKNAAEKSEMTREESKYLASAKSGGKSETKGKEVTKGKAEAKVEVESKTPSKQISYEMFTSGQTIEEIAKERQVTVETVGGHLLECLNEGQDVDFSNYITEEYEKMIRGAVGKVGGSLLKVIKEALPDEIPYYAIKFVLSGHKSKK